MSDSLDDLLEHAKKDAQGNVAIAHLRRADEDAWDALAIGANREPLVFWASGQEPDMKDVVVRDDGSWLSVVAATPPGVEPAGLMTVPADASGSPLAKLVSVVAAERYTMVADPMRPAPAPQPPAFGPTMLQSLLARAAAQRDGGFMVREVDAKDGGPATILLDWNGRPLLFWTEMPGGGGRRELMAVMAVPDGGGIVAMAVDDALRPLHSSVALARLLDDPPKEDTAHSEEPG